MNHKNYNTYIVFSILILLIVLGSCTQTNIADTTTDKNQKVKNAIVHYFNTEENTMYVSVDGIIKAALPGKDAQWVVKWYDSNTKEIFIGEGANRQSIILTPLILENAATQIIRFKTDTTADKNQKLKNAIVHYFNPEESTMYVSVDGTIKAVLPGKDAQWVVRWYDSNTKEIFIGEGANRQSIILKPLILENATTQIIRFKQDFTLFIVNG